MSSLIFQTDQHQAFVAVDTLATLVDGTPLRFTSKVLHLPQFRMLIASTGVADVLSRWLFCLNSELTVTGIHSADAVAPSCLRVLMDRMARGAEAGLDLQTTVYHFGFSELTNEMTAFAYRSIRDFESEALGFGAGVKPDCSIPQGLNFLKDVQGMMTEQRMLEAKKPTAERVYIGGKIVTYHLNRQRLIVRDLGRFEDYQSCMNAIRTRAARCKLAVEAEAMRT